MIVFPNAKINLGLNILRKREDNYHDLQSIFLPIDLSDALEVVEDKSISGYEFYSSGLKIDAEAENNLVVKAYKLLKNDFDLPAVKIHLHKKIPFGAGIGGGSADASFMLRLLNEMFALQLKDEVLEKYAVRIGADCPFFIKNTPALVTGIGDKLQPIDVDFSDFKILLIKPQMNINTSKIFGEITPSLDAPNILQALSSPISNWKKLFKNDFENVIFERHHEIKEIKNKLYEAGAFYASMSGSGSVVFAFFEDKIKYPTIKFPCDFFECKLIN